MCTAFSDAVCQFIKTGLRSSILGSLSGVGYVQRFGQHGDCQPNTGNDSNAL